MTQIPPVHLGRFAAMKAGDVLDRYIDIAGDLVTGESVSSVAYTVTDAAGEPVADVVTASTESGTRSDFRLTVPDAGAYTLTAVFTIDDGQEITKTASLWSV